MTPWKQKMVKINKIVSFYLRLKIHFKLFIFLDEWKIPHDPFRRAILNSLKICLKKNMPMESSNLRIQPCPFDEWSYVNKKAVWLMDLIRKGSRLYQFANRGIWYFYTSPREWHLMAKNRLSIAEWKSRSIQKTRRKLSSFGRWFHALRQNLVL